MIEEDFLDMFTHQLNIISVVIICCGIAHTASPYDNGRLMKMRAVERNRRPSFFMSGKFFLEEEM